MSNSSVIPQELFILFYKIVTAEYKALKVSQETRLRDPPVSAFLTQGLHIHAAPAVLYMGIEVTQVLMLV